MPSGTPRLALRGVSKAYGSVQALDGVDLDLWPGEIHALIGENGAGKSTLVKVVAGLAAPDAGELLLDGAPLDGGGRKARAAAGIGVVHQHFSLVDTLTVAENAQLGRPGAGRRVRLGAVRAELADWGSRTGLDVDPDAVVGALSIGERQRVEILTSLVWGARVLLLDEPTAVLSPLEADAALDVVRQLTGAGLAVLLVTHKLREVEAVADRVTVLRGGRVSGRHEGRGVPRDQLVAEMLAEGRALGEPPIRTPGEVRLSVRGLHVGRCHGVDLDVRAGEVVGVAGVAGNGQVDLVRAVVGLSTPRSGEVRVSGRDVHGDPAAARAAGVAYIPEDRAGDGLALGLPVWTNAVAKRTSDVGGWRGLDRDRVAAITQRVIDLLRVRPGRHEVVAGALSGGNQQRLVIGRELDEQPSVIVAAEPTRGLDPGSALDVIDALGRAADAGAAVVVVSSDLDELLVLARRVVVLFHGQVALDVDGAELDRGQVGRAMVGA